MIARPLIPWMFVLLFAPPVAAGEWELIGPGGGGRITSIREDPSDPNRLYMTINVGGARRSADGGVTWEVINRGLPYAELGQAAQSLGDIAVHPRNGQVLLAAGLNGCVMASTDRGDTWHVSHRLDAPYDLSRFSFDPGDPDVVYLGVGSLQKLMLGVGAKRTGNFWPRITSGPTILRGRWVPQRQEWEWQGVGSVTPPEGGRGGGLPNVYSIGIDPFARQHITCVTDRGVFRCQIGPNGVVPLFERITMGLPPSELIHGGQVAFDPRTSGVAYLTLVNLDDAPDAAGRAAGGVFKSQDGGRSWTRLTGGLDLTHSNYLDLQLHPRDPGRLYLAQFMNEVTGAAGTLYRSTDAGASWTNVVARDRLETGWLLLEKLKLGPDFVSVSSAPGETVRWSNGGGVLFQGDLAGNPLPSWVNILTRRNGASGGGWTTTGSEALAWPASVAVDPSDPRVVYLPYGDHAWFKSRDGGRSMSVLAEFSTLKKAGNTGDTATLLVDERDPRRLYAATRGPHQQLADGGVMRSVDGGTTWATIGGHLDGDRRPELLRGLPRGAMTDLLLERSATTPCTSLYVAQFKQADGGPGGVYRLADVDGDGAWERVSPPLRGCRALALRPASRAAPGTRGAAVYVGVDEQGVVKLTCEGGQWKVVWTQRLGRATRYFDLETGISGDIYVASDDGLFRLDGGDHPQRLSPQPEPTTLSWSLQALELHPRDERLIYVASERGSIHRSTDGGLSWTDVGVDLPTGGVLTLALSPRSDEVYAASPGAGVWRRSFP